jgi:hypothetical protein
MIPLVDLIALTDIELVGGNLIIGVGENRRFVGAAQNGSYTLNDEGREIAQSLTSDDSKVSNEKPKPPKRKAVALDPVEGLISELNALGIE